MDRCVGYIQASDSPTGFRCHGCRHPVSDHDSFCSECGGVLHPPTSIAWELENMLVGLGVDRNREDVRREVRRVAYEMRMRGAYDSDDR